jgi:intracellular sulfur oxidation DsrE/DsrF family protein
MKKQDSVSDEQLNAFVDGELENSEREQLFTLCEESAELDKRLCQQRKLKEMIQHAYRTPPKPRRLGHNPRPGRRWFVQGMAAAALVSTGILGGYLIAGTVSPHESVPGEKATQSMVVTEEPGRYLLHLTSAEPADMMRTLEYAESLLTDPDRSDEIQVEILANEGGIDLLRSDVTPFATQISSLADKEVLFFACSKTVERLKNTGIHVELVPQASAEFSALDRVLLRLQEDWDYLKI